MLLSKRVAVTHATLEYPVMRIATLFTVVRVHLALQEMVKTAKVIFIY